MRQFLIIILLIQGLHPLQAADSPLTKIPKAEGRLIMNITLDQYLNGPKELEINLGKSRGFSFMFMGETKLAGQHVKLGWGLGLNSHNVRHNSFIVYNADKSKTNFSPIADSVDYDKNKLSLNYFTHALELRFATNANKKDHKFFLHTGLMGGFLIQSHTKFKDDDGKTKEHRIRNLNKYQYGPYARLGYANIACYGYYSLVEVFKADKGPSLTPMSFGVSLVF